MESVRREADERDKDPFERVSKLNETALKIFTIGIPAEVFMGKTTAKHVILYVVVHTSTTLFGLYELATSFWLSESFLDLVTHWYVALYSWCFAFHFTYVSAVFRELNQSRGNEHFRTTGILPEQARRFLTRNIDDFKVFMVVFLTITLGAGTTYVLGAIVEVGLEFASTGKIEKMFILSYYASVPLWGQAVVFVVNLFTTIVSLTTTISIFMITGVRALTIKTQCQIINAALADEHVDLRSCIDDHVELLKLAKRSLEIFRILNNFTFFTLYSSLAIQLMNLSLIEPDGAYFFSMLGDFTASLLIIHGQSWFSATITLSLESIAEGAYFSHWSEKNKAFASNIMMITRAAHRQIRQTLWLDTMTLDRATALRVLQSSYSFYTILMVLQGRRDT